MPAPVLSGPQYLREGLKLVLSPGLRLFVLLPLAINLVLFVGLIYLAGHQFSLWVDTLMPSLPDWLSFLSYVLWPLFVVLVLLMVFFTFTMLANIIAAPFNGFLAEKVEVVVRGTDDFPAFSWAELIAMIPRTLGREARKLGYFLPRALVLANHAPEVRRRHARHARMRGMDEHGERFGNHLLIALPSLRDPYFDDMAPEKSGVTHVNLETGQTRLIITHRQLATTGTFSNS